MLSVGNSDSTQQTVQAPNQPLVWTLAQKQAGLSSPVLQISETHFTLVLKTKNVDPKGFPTVISLFRHLCGRNKDFSPAPF